MNNKEILEKYLINLFNIYKDKNFGEFIDLCLNYNIRIGDYKKNISNESKKVFDSILEILPSSKPRLSYKEFINSYKINVVYTYVNESTPKVIMDIPVFLENYEKIILRIIQMLVKERINFNIKLLKEYKNPIVQLKVDNINVAKKINDYFINDEIIKEEVKSRVLPFLPQFGFIGYSLEYKPFNFKNFYFLYLYKFFNKLNNNDEISLIGLQNFFESEYKSERRLNKKRMLLGLYKSIYIINNEEKIDFLYSYDSQLNIGSINPNFFDLKIDEQKMIYFINKEDQRIISYGSEDYLNLVYSKFYENVIKKEKNEVYYSYFYTIYSKILEDNYRNIDKHLDFSDINNDEIYQLMMLISSGFFAYKKMNFSLDDVYEILSYVLEIKLGKKIIKKEQEEFNKKREIYIFPLNIDYGNKVIDLNNGLKTTVKEYFRENKVIETIPVDSMIIMKDGNKVKGIDFLNEIYKYIPNFNSFNDLRNNMIELIEFK